ncbi:MAG: acyl-CoA thioesterase [Proteobacteria bacterium]|nr:acyl-CoA thioesterase [Pseudomonadota bacterium]
MTKNREPVLRISPRLADLNLNGNIFGGWVLSQMDIAGGITAARRARGTVATVAIEAMKFVRPIRVGDLVSCYAEIVKVGTTSITVKIDVTAIRAGERETQDAREVQVTKGLFIFVALDEKGRPRPVPEN